jgi:hypothetical protein
MILLPILLTLAVTFAIFKDPYPSKKTTKEIYQEKIHENGGMNK